MQSEECHNKLYPSVGRTHARHCVPPVLMSLRCFGAVLLARRTTTNNHMKPMLLIMLRVFKSNHPLMAAIYSMDVFRKKHHNAQNLKIKKGLFLVHFGCLKTFKNSNYLAHRPKCRGWWARSRPRPPRQCSPQSTWARSQACNTGAGGGPRSDRGGLRRGYRAPCHHSHRAGRSR